MKKEEVVGNWMMVVGGIIVTIASIIAVSFMS